jgi:acid phosphatase
LNPRYSTADDWLRQWLPVIMGGRDYLVGDLTVIVTFDVDDRTVNNLILTSVIALTGSKVVVETPLTHYSLSRYRAELGGLPPRLGYDGGILLCTAFFL